MAKRKTDFRLLRSKRLAALDRPELRDPPKARPPSPADIDRAIALGKFNRLPDGKAKT